MPPLNLWNTVPIHTTPFSCTIVLIIILAIAETGLVHYD